MLFIIIRLSLILIGTMKFAMHGSKHVKIICYIIEWPHVIFLTQQTQDTTMVTMIPRIGEGPGLDSQGCVTLFNKYCFPNLHRILGNAIEVEDCEFVPVLHPRK